MGGVSLNSDDEDASPYLLGVSTDDVLYEGPTPIKDYSFTEEKEAAHNKLNRSEWRTSNIGKASWDHYLGAKKSVETLPKHMLYHTQTHERNLKVSTTLAM
jgi:hypothetical protein